MNRPSGVQASKEANRRLQISLAITLIFAGIEAWGGLFSRSLALLADAGHMLTDAAAIGLSLFASWLSWRPMTYERTFGWRRFEIFAALLNGLTLWAVAGYIVYEAVQRYRSPQTVNGKWMFLVGLAGLAANGLAGFVLVRHKDKNINIRGAYLHVLADALSSLGVIVAALFVWLTGWVVLDPMLSLVISILILYNSGKLVRQSFRILMDVAPDKLNISGIRLALQALSGVTDVHDFHVWTIASGFISLSAHLRVTGERPSQDILAEALGLLARRFQITHATIQLESETGTVCLNESCKGV